LIFDVAIIGGGPAGAATGIYLSRAGRNVAILEATSYDTPRFGETLPPDVHPALRDLGVWDAFLALSPTESPGIVSVWGGDRAGEQDFLSSPHGAGWCVDRNSFDAMLLTEAGRLGAHICTSRRAAAPERTSSGWSIGEIAARFVVDAAGRNGVKLEARCERDIDDVLLAITVLVSYDSGPPPDRRTHIETAPDGWWYSGLLPNGDVMAMFFTDPETYREQGIVLGEALSEAPLTRTRLAGGRIRRTQVVYAPSCCRKQLAGSDWLPVGDSASCYDPLSGRGVLKAMRQASAAAKAVLTGNSEEYGKLVRGEFDHYVRQRRVYYAAERRWEGSGFWKRRLLR
jgi:flavin-dependent dehydrogenase